MSKSKKPSEEGSDTAKADLSLEQIRQAGICKCYEQLKDQGLLPRECLKKTADFARISERHAEGILTDRKQRTGRKTGSVSEYLEKIEVGSIKSKKAENQKGNQIFEEISREIRNDPNLNEEEKRALKAELDSRRQETKALLSSQNTLPKESQFKSIADIAKNAKI